MKWFYHCSSYGATYEIVPGRYLCDACAQHQGADRPLEGILEVEWDGTPTRNAIPLPVESSWFSSIPVGNTPLRSPARLRREFSAPNLWIKDDTCNPSGSFKDRASYLVAQVRREGCRAGIDRQCRLEHGCGWGRGGTRYQGFSS